MRHLTNGLDWALSLGLAVLGAAIVPWRPLGLDMPSAAALAGALFGGAALLLGNAIHRGHERKRGEAERAERAAKMRALIMAEMVDLAGSLLDIDERLGEVIPTLVGDSEVDGADLHMFRLRDLPYTFGLGANLLLLDLAAVEALAALRSSLYASRQHFDEVRVSARLGRQRAKALARAVASDMLHLAQALERVAPPWAYVDHRTEHLLTRLRRAPTAILYA
ncbi:hypothetical protein ACI2UK_13585 [Ralstonia nicotianae]|uniref:hypothetical protein n=1 Tax=Ralstonia pseudosolanacearum TaxID=1310165 RepID=UPI002003EF3D|nr:hypothetical protein [Ralstonia pseudosolanacearum]MCK4118423.1 hypothetical protein [Ralstonia pseudosolanacearum]